MVRRDCRRLEHCVCGATGREVACHLCEPKELAGLVLQRGECYSGPEGRTVAAYPLSLAAVLAALGCLYQVLFGSTIVGSASGIEQAQMRAFCLILGPPLDEPRAL